MAQHKHIINLISKQVIPPLSSKLHKGQAGRIGVIGGSGDYTGAPFFSAMGAMRFGADLAHVICEPNAASVIKGYSPDLIVHGILDPSKSIDEIKKELKGIMERLHVLIIGPGLGRTEHTQNCARAAFELAKQTDLGVVVDADGLFLVANDPSVILNWPGVPRVVLTPNVMEFKRLCEKMQIDPNADPDTLCPLLSRALENTTILQKGAIDIVSNGFPIPPALLPKDFQTDGKVDILKNEIKGGLKRCGGQGDILSGSVGVLLAWAGEWVKGVYEDAGHPAPSKESELGKHIALLAAYGGSTFNRTCSRRTFEDKGRSMQTEDMIPNIHKVFEEVFGNEGVRSDEAKEYL
ncbi:hypothetical protein QFC22_005559 [Naganishia vaughanmartiniae]|uniref:Uncharacterized protein n=1 Tax=Naganishia vaughanmartiniae TaxID=1424756 RepID=A0ACC2WSE5_9TREE|nr:hypothetical protein QFC22_005559 [Naganishia vaughanmartiniae]